MGNVIGIKDGKRKEFSNQDWASGIPTRAGFIAVTEYTPSQKTEKPTPVKPTDNKPEIIVIKGKTEKPVEQNSVEDNKAEYISNSFKTGDVSEEINKFKDLKSLQSFVKGDTRKATLEAYKKAASKLK